MMPEEYSFSPVGFIHSCYGEKFAVPRQPGLVNSAISHLTFEPEYALEDAVRGLDQFSHVWVLFVFHQSVREQWKTTVRPPRLGGNERIGVFASRSNFRPNPIGLSVVQLEDVVVRAREVSLVLRGGDFVDQTPVLDIKPYVPYADSYPNASGGFAGSAPVPGNQVEYSTLADTACHEFENENRPALRQLIKDVLSYNPRPAYQSNEPERIYGTRLFDLDVRWTQSGDRVVVEQIEVAVPQD